MTMLSCPQITELVTDYLEGRLPLKQRLQFQMHIGMCRHCRRYLRQMRLTIRTLGSMPPEPPPADVLDELMRRFDDWRP